MTTNTKPTKKRVASLANQHPGVARRIDGNIGPDDERTLMKQTILRLLKVDLPGGYGTDGKPMGDWDWMEPDQMMLAHEHLHEAAGMIRKMQHSLMLQMKWKADEC